MTDLPIEHRITGLEQRLNVFTWVLGISAGLLVATLGSVITLSYQMGQLSGRLDVLIGHVVLK